MVEKKSKSKEVSKIPFSRYVKASRSSSPEVRKEIYSQYEKRRSQVNKQEAKRKLESTEEKVDRFTSQFHAPSISGNRSYKAGNPLKKVLAHKGTTVKVSGSKERTNLMRGSW